MDDVTKTVPKVKKTADPVITEIVRNGLVAVTEEMKINLMRTAYNMIIYEALDFTVGLFDARGNIVSIGLGLPMFIRGMSETVRAKLNHFGPENIDPGDILLTNDAYITGSHLNHMTFSVRSLMTANWSASHAAWRTGRTSAAPSWKAPPTSTPKACRCRW